MTGNVYQNCPGPRIYTAWDVQDVVWPWKMEHPAAAVVKVTALPGVVTG